MQFIPYQLYYPEDVGNFNTKNGAQRLIRVLELISENYDELLQADMENLNEDANEMGWYSFHTLFYSFNSLIYVQTDQLFETPPRTLAVSS